MERVQGAHAVAVSAVAVSAVAFFITLFKYLLQCKNTLHQLNVLTQLMILDD